ncbi:MAG: hypothetical protein P1Q69_01900 [Candidatus Thorarchaeota archaeon]|nr:hypothetical protein [Candidatus Thorarchaeota archaeon]
MKLIGSRDEPQDRSGTWPSKTLAKAIEKHGPKNDTDKRIRMNLVDCIDVTKETQETPRTFPFPCHLELSSGFIG